MNYKISLMEMDRLAVQTNSSKPRISLEELSTQAKDLKSKSISEVKANFPA